MILLDIIIYSLDNIRLASFRKEYGNASVMHLPRIGETVSLDDPGQFTKYAGKITEINTHFTPKKTVITIIGVNSNVH